jgi:hypothetical protein
MDDKLIRIQKVNQETLNKLNNLESKVQQIQISGLSSNGGGDSDEIA